MRYWLALLLLGFGVVRFADTQTPNTKFENPDLSAEERAADLVSRMTLEEKVSQMQNAAVAIPRLGIPAYDWWNEALHGVARAGIATVFPQAIGLAATWDTDLHFRIADVISTEARAKYNDAIAHDNHARYFGLTFWSPNINIFRDPRWGRGQETYGEDPYLTSRLGVAFIKGMQGNDPHYFKTIATSKHYAVHSGPEISRHRVNVDVTPQDLENTYLYAFHATLTEGPAYSVMCAYNSVNGAPACANTFLLQDTLRQSWKFPGYVVSDCDAVDDIYSGHHYAHSLAEASAEAVKAGTDLDCGKAYQSLVEAVHKNLISEQEINRAVERLFVARIRLGMFDPPDRVPFSKIGMDQVASAAHQQLALEAAEKSMVLLKNDNNILPIERVPRTIAVLGPAADDRDALLGNYNGTPSFTVTPLEGIRAEFGARATVRFAPGSPYVAPAKVNADAPSMEVMLHEGIELVKRSDLAILCIGLNSKLEGEEMPIDIPGFSHGDRTDIQLPPPQERLLESVLDTGKPVIVILINGSALAVAAAKERAAAILEAWYPGQEGGTAIARTLAAKNNPAGRLPITFYKSVDQLPPFTDYSMKNRTYRYFTGEPLYPFGYGLSYSTFEYSGQSVNGHTASARVTNTSKREGDEVVQLYIKTDYAPNPVLKGFERIHLGPGENRVVSFTSDDINPNATLFIGNAPRR
ncbi:MAG TPA: glycoside hydrolase family 3 C-terminal domain-containing protein [Bryobacteraceae bacterium]|nr:glycoside hydrolase family 3 C-terminal domain-containing protein [Bryobacteraceae bacterium]HTW66282.1 glycoside hydrolase family 3 C-terminal domain-containing protein [Bryobacteraceae bacterium]